MESNETSPCAVLVDLANIQALFDPHGSVDHADDSSTTWSEEGEPYFPRVDAYPLAFLKSVGNIQADGIPPCFYPLLTEINRSVRKPNTFGRPSPDDEYDELGSEDGEGVDDGDDVDEVDDGEDVDEVDEVPRLQAVKPVSCQFYNYITHRVATRAGRHDAQQGTVTAAVSGAFSRNQKDNVVALNNQSRCDQALPSARFHAKISLEDSPTSCRAEFVYSVDVRALKDPSGTHVSCLPSQLHSRPSAHHPSCRFIFNEIILPLARAWKLKDVRSAMREHLMVLKPGVGFSLHLLRIDPTFSSRAFLTFYFIQVFPALFDWVSYPVTLLIELLYKNEMKLIREDIAPSFFHVELIAALERILCFCHTGNTAVLATSLMNPLGLSYGVLKDGFPMLLRIFSQSTVASAMKRGIEVIPRRWPMKDGYPAIASRRAQILTYSLAHFMVSLLGTISIS